MLLKEDKRLSFIGTANKVAGRFRVKERRP